MKNAARQVAAARRTVNPENWNTLYVGERIREARERLGHTQEQFAYLFRFNSMAVSHWECGRRDPSLENFVRLCCALNVTPNQLLKGI